MAEQLKKNQTLVLSVLDRLLDDDPALSVDAPKTPNQLLRELKIAVRRDLENLLNTRWRCVSWPPLLDELETSLVNYGIPDFTSANLRGAEDPEILCQAIAAAIGRFEPRLMQVRVERTASAASIDRVLRFRIDAVLCVEPVEDRVLFNSSLEPTTGNFHVE